MPITLCAFGVCYEVVHHVAYKSIRSIMIHAMETTDRSSRGRDSTDLALSWVVGHPQTAFPQKPNQLHQPIHPAGPAFFVFAPCSVPCSDPDTKA